MTVKGNSIGLNARLTGVGGWLLLPMALVAFQVVLIFWSLLAAFYAAVILGNFVAFGFSAVAGTFVPFILLGLAALWSIFRRKRIARLLMIAFFAIDGLVGGADFLLALTGSTGPSAPDANRNFLAATFCTAAGACIIIGYFLRSKRVKLTLAR